MCVNVSVCQPPSETHRECASQTATPLDLRGFVDASISSFWSFFSNLALCDNVCHCVSVSASLTHQQGECKSHSNWSGSMWLHGGFHLIFLFIFFPKLASSVEQSEKQGMLWIKDILSVSVKEMLPWLLISCKLLESGNEYRVEAWMGGCIFLKGQLFRIYSSGTLRAPILMQ